MDGRDSTKLIRQVGARITQLRARRRLAVGALATLSGLTVDEIVAIENGQAQVSTLELRKIAVGLDVTFADLFIKPIPTIISGGEMNRDVAEMVEWADRLHEDIRLVADYQRGLPSP